jgi:enoyl-CoA hydratase/carnithine racemase
VKELPVENTDGPLVSTTLHDVQVLRFNRPERRNAWNHELARSYADQLSRADADPSVRAIVVSGVGSAFCAGADLTSVGTNIDATTLPFLWNVESALRVRKPMVAAINGAAVGLGLVQALYCDVRFCVPEAKLSTAFARRGFVAEFGMASLLTSMVGQARATDWLLSGRAISGEDAYAAGLVNFLVSPNEVLDSAIAYARELAANCSPRAMAVIKDQIRRESRLEFWQALQHAEKLQLESLDTADVAEGFRAFAEKRVAKYEPLS